MSVRIAILGNSFAKAIQLPALRWAAQNGAPNEVVAIAGHDPAKAKDTADAWSIPHATGDWETLFDGSLPGGAPDLAIISTPVHLHAPMLRAALGAGTAILCEKPFALDGDEARGLRDAARGHFAVIDHQTRWSPWRREMAKRIERGDLGTRWFSRVQMNHGAAARIDRPFSWWYDAERGGGTLGALGSHMLDGILDQFGARFGDVSATLSTYITERAGPDGAPVPVTADEGFHLAASMTDGSTCMVESNLMAFGSPRDAGQGNLIEASGSKGVLRLEGETELMWIPTGGDPEAVAVEAIPTHEELGMPQAGFFSRVLPLYLRDVVQAVAEGSKTLPGAATLDDAVHVMDVLDAARASAREGRRIQVRTDSPGA